MGDRRVEVVALDLRAAFQIKTWSMPSADEVPFRLSGLEASTRVGKAHGTGTRILCTGPTEWLLISGEQQAPALGEVLAAGLSQERFAFADLTAGIRRLGVRGAAARELLSRCCGLDFHPREFPVGRCARTRLAQIPVTIDCPEDPDRFELLCARSYGGYLQSWVIDCSRFFY